MIDGSEKRNRQLAFELQNSHVCEKRSKSYTDGEEKSLRLVTIVAKPLDINKSWSCKYDRGNKKMYV